MRQERTVTIYAENIDDIIAGCIANKRQSQNKLFDLYRDKLYGLVFKMLGPGSDNDDTVQLVFINIFHSIGSFKKLSSFDTWVYKIAYKTCVDQIRKKYRKKKLNLISGSHEIAVSGKGITNTEYNADNKVLSKETSTIVFEALERLKPEKRAVIIFHELENKSVQEIAKITGKPRGTVKSRLFHAKKDLKKYLKKYM